MRSPFTWLALVVFVGLAALMLQRSVAEKPVDKLWLYAPPAIGCAIVDYLGNRGFVVAPIAGLIAIIAYILLILRPSATTKP